MNAATPTLSSLPVPALPRRRFDQWDQDELRKAMIKLDGKSESKFHSGSGGKKNTVVRDKIYEFIRNNGPSTSDQISEGTGVSVDSARYHLRKGVGRSEIVNIGRRPRQTGQKGCVWGVYVLTCEQSTSERLRDAVAEAGE